MKYEIIKLQDVVDKLGDGLHGTPIYDNNGEYYFINGNNLDDGKIVFKENTKKVSREEYHKYKKDLNDRTILVSINGTLGNVAVYKNEKVMLGKSACYFNVIENVNKDYIKYVIMSPDFKKYLEQHYTGTTIKNVSLKTMRNYTFKLPSENHQLLVSKILSSLDSKIELNNQIISNLEELASTLFKRWFVDFEFPDENGNPYKSSGGKMVDSELGKIPEGWEITELKSIVDVVDNRGKTPPLEKDKTDFPIIDVKTLSGNGRVVNYNKAQKYVSEETYSSWFRSGHPKINDILISTVGSIGEIKMFLTDKGTIAQNVVGLRAKKHLEYHLYQFLLYNKSNLITYNIGSVQPSIKVTHLLKHKVLLPNKKDLNKFNSVMIGLTDKIINLSKEINSLTEIRDSLLPKLLSGEVELPEDEEV
ncbi:MULTISPECIES: restriction endonuclease subunit S [Enterococcus]|uniref:restriction endonuclease subunit S n=1 Tax=Enterococcus TaxID=1350 RepID=UPI000FA4E36C|nr:MULTISPECIES: restriction endonuclease subunit S [Enterococcus]MDE5175428.1 restriction endonuclease subunit S [Enterococcus faecium]MEB4786524.1 restriction endonuclease subunit S [Enterococcus sp. E4-150]NTM46685.1 restriction endonuclease subunit S [Enterococcus faecium]RRQ80091.1 restriction endonuclease subunit S [Enterococcus faecium]